MKEKNITMEPKEVYRQDTEDDNDRPLKIKGRISGFLAMGLTIIYAIFIVSFFGENSMEEVGAFLASMIMMPHMLCVAVAACLSLVGFFGKKRWAMLTSGIMMAVSGVLMFTYFPFVIVQAVLFFISYARMGVVY